MLGKPTSTVPEILDLNIQVDNLLRKQKIKHAKPIPKHYSGIRVKRKRFRKNKDQQEILQAAFDEDINWGKDVIKQLSHELGLKEAQIYKWNWDQRKKSFPDNCEQSHDSFL